MMWRGSAERPVLGIRSPATIMLLAAAAVALPVVAGAQDAEGYDAFVQSGTCASPTDDVRAELEGEGDHDVPPYEATAADGDPVVLGYYGAPALPGIGLSAVYTAQEFSLVVTDVSGEPVSCGDLLRAEEDRFRTAGTAVVQLTPLGGGTVHGIAVVNRAQLERELDVTPTQVRILLTEEVGSTTADMADGYDGHVQGGWCDASDDEGVRVELKSYDDSDTDVRPFTALTSSGDTEVPAFYGSPLAPGFGLAAAYTDVDFSIVLTDGGDQVACGDLLRPASSRFTEAGVALVQLQPVGDAGVQGFALVQRLGMERELDVTPTRVQVVLLAPPIGG
jgi:hypothetical protein